MNKILVKIKGTYIFIVGYINLSDKPLTLCTQTLKMYKKISFIFLVILLCNSLLTNNLRPAFSQILPNDSFSIPDTLTDETISDSSLADTTLADTLKTQKISKTGMDTTLHYDAKMIDINVPERITVLTGKAVVKYKSITLKAEKITVNWNNNLMTAEGVLDSVSTDTTSDDTLKKEQWRGLPVLSDRGDIMYGFKLIYNFKSEKGRVIKGRTNFESGYYFGESMKKVGKNVINISNGLFTTCEKEEDPHFHFSSRKIKVIPKDKVIAKPVVFYIGKIPVALIPFAVFPHKSGRHSGVVIPSFGQSGTEGRYIRGLGYYWAPNDYFDSRLLVDYYDRSGWMLRGDINYARRYLLNGSIGGSFTRKDLITGQSERRWDLLVSHNQTIDPTTSLNINGTFVSDNSFYKDYSSNLNTQLTREIRSNATFRKNWTEQRMSLTANLSQTRDIETGRITQTLPQLRFTVSQRRIIPFKNDNTSKKQSSSDLKWYHSIYFNYNNSLYNRQIKGGDYPESSTRYFDHNLGFSMNSPSKIFGWLTLGQSLSYQERWYDRYKENTFDPGTNSVEVDTVNGFTSRRTFNYSLSSSTNIYGMFTPNIGNIKAIRHVITPNVSFNFQPDFADPYWGYVDTFIDTLGNEITKSRFMDAVSVGARRSMSFSVKNLFQMKTQDGEKEKKFDLLSINSRSSYNFEAEQFKISPLYSSIRSTVIKNLNMNISTTHDFYQYDTNNNTRVNKLIISKTDWWKRSPLRLTNFQISTSLRLQGSRKDSRAQTSEEENAIMTEEGEFMAEDEYYDRKFQAGGQRFEAEHSFSGLDIPWRASLSFDFRYNKTNPDNPSESYYVNLSTLEVQLTKKWKINYNARYDLKENQLINHSFTFYRDMHCWEARFVWRPSGIGAPYFYFKINVKASQLQDLKWDKRGGKSSVFGY